MAFNFRKIKLGFVNLILDFLPGQDKAAVISKKCIEYITKTLGAEVVECDGAVGNRVQARAAWKKFKAQDVDGVILFNGTFNTGEVSAEIIRNLDCPFAVWGIGELSLENQSFTGSIVGVMPAGTIFKTFDRTFSIVYGTVDRKETQKQLATYVDAVRAIAYLKEAAIGIIGTRPDGFQISGYDELVIKKLFGTELIKISLYTLSKIINTIPDAEIDKDMREQNTIFDIAPDQQKAARGLSQVYLGLKKVVADYKLNAYAPDCWPEFRDNDLRPFCPANGRMNVEGVMASCECDVDGALSLMMLHAIQKDTPWFADFVNIIEDKNALLFWHCGNGPHTYSSKKPKIEPIFGGPSQIHGSHAGIATVCRLNSIRGEFTIHAGLGDVIESDAILKGSNLLIKMRGGNMDFVMSMLDNGIPHHNALIYGDAIDAVKEFGKLMRIPVIVK